MTAIIHRLRQDRRGSYVVEFAMLFLPLMTMLIGMIELGYFYYVTARTEGALREVSRLAATGEFASVAEIQAFVDEELANIPGEHKVALKSYKSFAAVAQPEPIESDVAPLGGAPGPGDCFTDVNDSGEWEADIGLATVGAAEDIVYFGIHQSYKPFFTLSESVLGESLSVSGNIAIKNEPYANAVAYESEKICIPVT